MRSGSKDVAALTTCPLCGRAASEIERKGHGETEITQAFDEAYQADQAQAEAGVRPSNARTRTHPLIPPKSSGGE